MKSLLHYLAIVVLLFIAFGSPLPRRQNVDEERGNIDLDRDVESFEKTVEIRGKCTLNKVICLFLLRNNPKKIGEQILTQ